MIPLSEWEELARRRVYSRLESRETFKLIGVVSFKEFSDSMYRWQLFSLLCLSSRGGYVLAKEMHEFPGESWSGTIGEDTFNSLDLIDLTQEEADQYRLLVKQPLENTEFQKPPLYV